MVSYLKSHEIPMKWSVKPPWNHMIWLNFNITSQGDDSSNINPIRNRDGKRRHRQISAWNSGELIGIYWVYTVKEDTNTMGSGWWLRHPSEKYESQLGYVGMMTFPTEWKNKTCFKPPTRDIVGTLLGYLGTKKDMERFKNRCSFRGIVAAIRSHWWDIRAININKN